MFDARDGSPWEATEPPALTNDEIAWLMSDEVDDGDRSRDWVAQVIAAGQTDPMTAFLIGQLTDIDPEILDDDLRVSYAVAWQRAVNHVQGRRAAAVAAVAARSAPTLDLHPLAAASSEIGSALHLGSGAADSLVSTSTYLPARLPRTSAMVDAGDLAWDKAVALAVHTAPLSVEQAREVEARVLPYAAGRTPNRHADAVRRWVERVDPEGASDRRRQAKRDVALIRSHYNDGTGEIFGRMTSEQVDTVWTAADAWARSAKAAGDARTLDELRIGALPSWAESYLTHGDATYCDQHCQPQLPDTDDTAPNDDQPDAGGPVDDGPQDGGGGGGDPASPPDNDGDPAAAFVPIAEEPVGAPTDPSRAEEVGALGPPRRHGRPVRVGMLWDLSSLLGVTDRCGELMDSGATLPADAIRDAIARGVRIRRMLIDPETGELVDLTPRTWKLPRAAPPASRDSAHGPPIVLGVILDTTLHTALTTGDLTGLDDDAIALVHDVGVALDAADPTLRSLVDHPITADALDDDPYAETPSPALAEFVVVRDRHPTNPSAGCTAASAGDLDHTISRADGGTTTRDNLTALTRRWHVLKTHGGWTVRRVGRHWEWTSPIGRTYVTAPYDYRLGP